jgi:farnesyl-diphosphate farnesyltransferase
MPAPNASAIAANGPGSKLYAKLGRIVEQLWYPSECYYLAKWLLTKPRDGLDVTAGARLEGKNVTAGTAGDKNEKNDVVQHHDPAESEAICFRLLQKTSRSFAAVIAQLNDELRVPICVFYLVLRALDTVEDDMSIPEERKKELLKVFYERLSPGDDSATLKDLEVSAREGILGIGDQPQYVELIEQFHHVVFCMRAHCSGQQRRIIADITKRMGVGMAEFVGKQSIDTVKEWDLYCHYVAGLVGIGLSELFATAACCQHGGVACLRSENAETCGRGTPDSLEQSENADRSHTGSPDPSRSVDPAHVRDLANQMGLFLQKTNIIRDYLEDVIEGRVWWPREIWGKYVSAPESLTECPRRRDCLNELIVSALEHAPACLEFMRLIPDPAVFRFCAVPQVMAIATLDKLYDNSDVFDREVKLALKSRGH